MNKKILALYGLKYNPFTPDVPTEALYVCPALENFFWRIEHTLIPDGGFSLLAGDPGTGKSAALRLLSERLSHMRDVQVGALTHSSARLSDFYRELGDIFGLTLKAHNRWHSFKQLRERWLQHLNTTLLHPVLFIDEAQEMPSGVLNELRLLTSMKFDSQILLSVILAGDSRLTDILRRDDLIPLGSRIRVRINTTYADADQLMQVLQHLLEKAGNPGLMTPALKQTLCEHAMGNHRALVTMAAELLSQAALKEKSQLDEQLYLECFAVPASTRKTKKHNVGGLS